MALIKCPECGREISDKALSCPACGYQVNKTNKIKVYVNVIPIILGIFSIFWGYSSMMVSINGYLGIWNNVREFMYGITVLMAGGLSIFSIFIKISCIISIVLYGLSVICAILLTLMNPANIILIFINFVSFLLSIIFYHFKWNDKK